MDKLPLALLDTLSGLPGFEREAFVKSHNEAHPVTAIRVNPLKMDAPCEASSVAKQLGDRPGFRIAGKVPWSSFGYYLETRPSFTFDPLFHAGCYYVQDASSMFVEQALTQLLQPQQPIRVLDLCAAPGGKSTLIQSLLPEDSLLVSNEVIRSRAHILRDNIIKWGADNVIVTNNDPAAFKNLPGYFDVLVVDAPCSGSGLFRKDDEAVEEWSLNNVTLCHQRQQRILSDALPCLREGGLLIYATCSYSVEEDEEIADWLTETWELENVALTIDENWHITVSQSPKHGAFGYRFYPYKVKGEGFFLTVFCNRKTQTDRKAKPARLDRSNANETAVISKWLDATDVIREDTTFYKIPKALQNDYAFLKNQLNVLYQGVAIGQIMKGKLVPDHALAMSRLLNKDVVRNELALADAILYLQKQEMHLQPEGGGWQLATYQNNNLGWINVLPNRINNYYPKELRILKRDRGDSEK